jgi:catechol 2,3-dioxygenase-like lactoylglutathione lyase family enzyme
LIEVQGVDCVRVPVDDIEAAKRFYGEVLGVPPGPTTHPPGNQILPHNRYAPHEQG